MSDTAVIRRPLPSTVIPLRDTVIGLGSLLLPAIGFIGGLWVLAGKAGYPHLFDLATYPWQLWVIGVTGTAATVCGFLDWHFHVTGRRPVGRRERHGELVALGLGGAPLFVLMSIASVSARPVTFLVPIVVVALFTSVMICYDEFVYHRRACGRYETILHRVLVLGNTAAWLAWLHWCFAAGVARG